MMFDVNIGQFNYYKLQEASEFLNTKYNTQNTTPIKLLKKAIEHKVRLFIYGRGFNVIGDYVLMSFLSKDRIPYSDMNEADKLKLREYNSKVNSVIDDMLSALVNSEGAFMQLNNEVIQTLPLTHKINTQCVAEGELFNGILPITEPKANSSNLDFIQNHLLDRFNDSVGFTLALYPKIEVYYDTEAELDIALAEAFKKCSLKIIDYDSVYEEDGEMVIDPYFEITLDDLIILNDDLVKLEHLILGNEIPEETLSSVNSITLGRKGLSKSKALAQHIAKHIAEKEWQADTDKKIRMSGMADIVWAKLYKLKFGDVIPDQAKYIKPWIKDIAPNYASEGGRPPSK